MQEHKNDWKHRRRIIYATLIFCAIEVAYLTVRGSDTSLNQAIVTSVVLLAAAVIGSYVFGATWDDSNKRKVTSLVPPSVRGDGMNNDVGGQ